jgi:hypothetical protein
VKVIPAVIVAVLLICSSKNWKAAVNTKPVISVLHG